VARRDGNAALAAAGRDCIKTLTGQDPGPAADAAEPIAPPVDPATVIGKHVTWTVETTAGTLVIALDPELAPWHVAALATLTAAHFYDGLRFHRVVPGFVVQGGDPTGAGWGGPGYTLPAEPTTTHYDAGVIGIADAGKDTGGSQWFAMHARAPHLEGRYTIVGRVVAGGEVVDALQIGDRILKATVEIN
jgi:cyclophilin family peptidyl-prolyl cis-trans isomerase